MIPLDGRGEALLEALRHQPSASWSHSRESLLVSEEEDDSSLMYSSTDDLGRKVVILNYGLQKNENSFPLGCSAVSGGSARVCQSVGKRFAKCPVRLFLERFSK